MVLSQQNPALNPAIAYDAFIANLKAQRVWDSAVVIRRLLRSPEMMTPAEQLAQIDRLKGWLHAFRPLPSSAVSELKKLYDVRFTYHSNAIEGNTLSQSETQLSRWPELNVAFILAGFGSAQPANP